MFKEVDEIIEELDYLIQGASDLEKDCIDEIEQKVSKRIPLFYSFFDDPWEKEEEIPQEEVPEPSPKKKRGRPKKEQEEVEVVLLDEEPDDDFKVFQEGKEVARQGDWLVWILIILILAICLLYLLPWIVRILLYFFFPGVIRIIIWR